MKKKTKRLMLTTIILSLFIVICAFQAGASAYFTDVLYTVSYSEKSGILNIITEEEPIVGMDNFYFHDVYGSSTSEEEGFLDRPWENYTKATKVVLGDHMTRIGSYAFYKFYNLKEMYIHEGITVIDENAFYDSMIPTIIYFGGTQEAWEALTENTDEFENSTVYYNVEPCTHEFTNYVSNNDATYDADGTKTALCDLCGVSDTVTDVGSKLALGNVKNLTSTPIKGGAEIKWEKVKDATGYGVFIRERYYNKNLHKYVNGWKLIEYTTNLNCTVELLDTMIAVRAFMIVDNYVKWAPAFEKVRASSLLYSPESFKAEDIQGTSLKLTWSDHGEYGYGVFMYTSSGWKGLKTIRGNTYEVNGLKPNTSYTFAVRSFRAANASMGWADKYTKITVKTTIDNPFFLGTYNKNELRWTNIEGETGYQIWYFAKGDTKYTKLGNFKADTTNVKVNLTPGKVYAFRVRAYKKVGNSYIYSAFSDAKAMTIR